MFGLSDRRLADELVGREALEGLEPASKVVGRDEVGKMLAELIVALVVEALDGGVLDRPVHPFDLAVGPGMFDFREPVFDLVLVADPIEDMVEGVLWCAILVNWMPLSVSTVWIP